MLNIQGKKNPNFKFEDLKQEYQEEAEKWVGKNSEVVYAYQTFDGGTAIVHTINKEDHRLRIIRMFELGNSVQLSVDVELIITED